MQVHSFGHLSFSDEGSVSSCFVAVPRAGWAEAFEQFGIPKGNTGPAEEMFEAVNAGWMDLGVEGTEHVAGTTSARDVFEAAQDAANS